MADYIDREKYCKKHCCNYDMCNSVRKAGGDCGRPKNCRIWKAPAADVAPVVHDDSAHNIEIVKEKLPLEERLLQLAEECNELAKAALKLRRAFDTKNPTPVFPADAYENLVEETADVLLCLNVIGMGTTDERIIEIKDRKAKRWVERLNNNSVLGGCCNHAKPT